MFKKTMVYKLTVGYILIILISTLLIGVFFINTFKEYTIGNKQKNMIQKATQISKMIEPHISENQNMPLYKDMINLIDSCVNANIWVARPDGTIIIMSDNSLNKEINYNVNKFNKEFINEILSGKETIIEKYNDFYGEIMLSAGAPIYDSSKNIVGIIILHSSMSNITSSIDKAFDFLISAIVLEIILAGLLGFYFFRFITKPINIMNKSAIEMTNGNYKVRTNIYRKDEIGELASSIDTLASKLEYTIDQLFQEKNKLNDLFLSISDGIIAFNLNMELINYNRSAEKILGYSKDELMLKFNEQEFLNEFKPIIINGDKKNLIKSWDGKIIRFSISPVKNNLKQIVGVVLLIQDISQQERLEQMRKDFIANVSHEFRTPLTLMRGSLEILIDRAIPYDEAYNYYIKLLKQTEGLQRMVNDLLDLSKLQSGKANLSYEKLDLAPLINDASRTMQFIANNKNIVIETDLEGNMPPILGDYDKLKQLLIIFIDNAIKYSYENSKIIISTKIKDFAYVEIRDFGIGISEDDLPYIWERFYKVDKSRNKNDSSTGLGLAIAKNIIELMNGKIHIDSKLGEGTTVEILIPIFNDGSINKV